MTSEKDLTIEALEKKLKIKEGIIDLMGQFTEKLQAELDDLQESSAAQLKEALANSDACWKLEQEMYVRQRDEARAEIERLRALLPPSAHTGVRNGPGEGSWAVFAEKVVEERDEARAEVARLREAMTASMNLCSFECSDETYCGRCAPLVRVLRQGQE